MAYICFRESNNGKSKRPYTITNATSCICCKTTIFSGILLSPPPEFLWPANLAGWWLTMSRSYPFSHLILWLRGLPRSRDKIKTTISTLTLPMATKLGRIMTYLERLLARKSHVPLVMWSCKMTRQTKIIISPQPQCLWPRNLSWWWLRLRGSIFSFTWLLNHVVLWDQVSI